MHTYAALGLWAVASYFIYLILSSFITKRRNARRARDLGCKPPPTVQEDFLGISNIKRAFKADKEHRFPDMLTERIAEMAKSKGRLVHTFDIHILGERQFFTCDPKNIQALLATQFKDFELGSARIHNFEPLLGHGIFASDGKQWERSRALLRPQFVRDQVSDLHLEERHVQNMMRVLPVQNASDGSKWTAPTDVQVLFFRLTIDSATEFLFGESVDSQLAVLPGYSSRATDPRNDEKTFAYAFDRSQWCIAKAARLGNLHWLLHTKEYKQKCAEVHAFVDRFVHLALSKSLREDVEKHSPCSPQQKDKYIFLDALAQQTQDPTELRQQLLNILLAGRDTTASLLSWLFLLLTTHPDHYTRLRAQILEDFGTYSKPKNITFSALKNCQLLQHSLNETLRLYPVVPINSRRSVPGAGTTIPRGGGPDGLSPVFVPGNTEVGYSVHVMHRRPEYWGLDADEYNPDRWIGRRPGWEYLPFNGGPRICIGQQFALTEAGYVVVRMLQRFDQVIPQEGITEIGKGEHGLTLTSCPAKGVNVRLREATDL